MERNNGRYGGFMRRQAQHHHSNNQHQSNSSLSSSSSSSLASSTNSNNNQHLDNHRNSSASSASSQYSTSSTSNNTSSAYSSTASNNLHREPILTQHDELIRYIREAWTKVNEQGSPTVHCNESDHQLKNFKPFNLEDFWGKRLVQNIHISQGNQ